jgi:DNA-binding MarR family transcriptional regulator
MKTEKIYDHLERIANLLRTDTRKAGVGKGLQPVQMEALHYLSQCNRYSNTPAAVADFLGLTKGTVSQTLSVLENAGFIEKRPDAKDKRVVHLQVTDLGDALLAESIPPQTLQTAMALTNEAEQAVILDALSRVLRALQQANQRRVFGVCKECKHHRIEAENAHRCALTGEVLQAEDGEKICREHEKPSDA